MLRSQFPLSVAPEQPKPTVSSMEPNVEGKVHHASSVTNEIGRDLFGSVLKQAQELRLQDPNKFIGQDLFGSVLKQAQELRLQDLNKFDTLRNVMKNLHTEEAVKFSYLMNGSKCNVDGLPGELEAIFHTEEMDYGFSDVTKPLTAPECFEIALVAKLLEQHRANPERYSLSLANAEKLKNIPITSKEVSRSVQGKVRHTYSLRGRDPTDMRACHYIGINVLVKMNLDVAPELRWSKKEVEGLVNHYGNVRMAKYKSNTFHEEVDQRVLSGETDYLTKKEVDRMLMIVANFQSGRSQKYFMKMENGAAIYDAVRAKFKVFKTTDGHVIWDTRHDAKTLRVSVTNVNGNEQHLKRDGTPDMRYKENKAEIAPPPAPVQGRLKKDRTPDMRYSANKTPTKEPTKAPTAAPTGYSSTSSGPLKSDGTPDMRYSANKTPSYTTSSRPTSSYTPSYSSSSSYSLSSSSSGPTKSDGTPDMRYKANW